MLKLKTAQVISHLQDRSLKQIQNHRHLCLLPIAYIFKYAYVMFEFVDYSKHPERTSEWRNFFPWLTDPILMDARNYVYLLGERVHLAIIFSLLHWYAGTWVTLFLFAFHTAYIFDFMWFYHTTPFGSVSMIAIGSSGLTMFIKWMRS